jgi:putative ABC transport system permease protein
LPLVTQFRLLRTLIVRPLMRDLLRTALTLMAVSLGVAVVIGIELAGDAAGGSFQSSLTTVAGKTDLQISANGGVDEEWMGKLAALPMNVHFIPVMERLVKLDKGGAVTLYGVDALSDDSGSGEGVVGADADSSVAVSSGLASRLSLRKGDTIRLRLGYGVRAFRVERMVEAKKAEFIAMDIATAQFALKEFGTLDRIEAVVGPGEDFEQVERAVRSLIPPGYQVDRPGTRSNENQRMLRAFRWNLRMLSYISLVVGAFLIYNTISISVVRRRPEIGILRALGVARASVFSLFMVEALLFGMAGSLLGIGLGRIMAEGLVGLVSATVNSLYASSRPAAISLTWETMAIAGGAGLAVALTSAFGPALEATRVTPREAMSRGSRERTVSHRSGRFLTVALMLAALALIAGKQGSVNGSPLFGYASVLLAIGAAAMVAPALVTGTVLVGRTACRRMFGVAGLIAAQGLVASLGRTSVIVAALATAIAIMASVGIMVGSFRETVVVWLDSQLRADIYVRAAGPAAAGVFPPLASEVPGLVSAIPGVEAVDIFSGLEFRYDGQRASLGGQDPEILLRYGRQRFLPGQDRDEILSSLKGRNRAIVTQSFASKHSLHVGDDIRLPLGLEQVPLRVAGIYYDYTSERGFVIVDRAVMINYLPNQPATNLGVYLKPGTDADGVLEAIRRKTATYGIDAAPNRELRKQAVAIFDRTFAVTYALEGVAIIVAMLGAANSLLAMVLARRREFGLLRYLGGATGQIRRMILVEAGLIGLMANLLGLALGFALSLVLIYVINEQSFGWSIQFHAPYFLLAAALSLVWCVTIVAGIYPARVASRLNPIDVIHEE